MLTIYVSIMFGSHHKAYWAVAEDGNIWGKKFTKKK